MLTAYSCLAHYWIINELLIFWFLHQTTTLPCPNWWQVSCISFDSYIKPQLNSYLGLMKHCCISFDSYIKPQLLTERTRNHIVVYLLIPTSNHNHYLLCCVVLKLYIFWFLHQTTTRRLFCCVPNCCISFDSYIKPQPRCRPWRARSVVYLLIPTSNHNLWDYW